MESVKNILSGNNPRTRAASRPVNVTELMGGAKLPPQAVDLEEFVLGALMLEKGAINNVAEILTPQSFYKDSHVSVYEAIQNLSSGTNPIDIMTVTEELKRMGKLDLVGGAYFVAGLTSRVASAANIEYHARIIQQKYLQRELIRISGETLRDAFEDSIDVYDLLNDAERRLFEVSQSNVRKGMEDMPKLLSKALKQIESAAQSTSSVTGVPSGFTALDRVTNGWQKSDLLILAARPAMGKTAFVLSMARNAAVDYKMPVAIFSLEMASVQLVSRLISAETELDAKKLKTGRLEKYEWEQLHSRIRKLENAPLYIDDTAGISVFEFRAKARRLKKERNIEMIIIDYLQLMTAGSDHKGNREQEIGAISRALKGVAKELDVPIIALSQLSRGVETRGTTRIPQLSDLRESGSIEQDADMVMFIYRPEYYGITVDEANNSVIGKAEIIIAKHRSGSTGLVPLRFIDKLAKFTDWDSFESMDNVQYNNLAQSNDFDEPGYTMTRTVKSQGFIDNGGEEDVPF